MKIKPIIDKCNNLHIKNDESISKEEIEENLPPGWIKFIPIIWNTSELCQVKISSFFIRNGTLYVRRHDTDELTLSQDIFIRVMRTIMIDSALTCMICGSFGRRRKNESGSPPLCSDHYLTYINEE